MMLGHPLASLLLLSTILIHTTAQKCPSPDSYKRACKKIAYNCQPFTTQCRYKYNHCTGDCASNDKDGTGQTVARVKGKCSKKCIKVLRQCMEDHIPPACKQRYLDCTKEGDKKSGRECGEETHMRVQKVCVSTCVRDEQAEGSLQFKLVYTSDAAFLLRSTDYIYDKWHTGNYKAVEGEWLDSVKKCEERCKSVVCDCPAGKSADF